MLLKMTGTLNQHRNEINKTSQNGQGGLFATIEVLLKAKRCYDVASQLKDASNEDQLTGDQWRGIERSMNTLHSKIEEKLKEMSQDWGTFEEWAERKLKQNAGQNDLTYRPSDEAAISHNMDDM